VLLDDGEQITEQPALLLGQLSTLDGLLRRRGVGAIDLAPSTRKQRRARGPSIRPAPAVLALGPPIAGAARGTTGRRLRPA
jgi:hypothetical protein